MLIEFRVKNCATLKDRTILSAEAATRLRKFKKSNVFYHQNPQLLKNLLILGPNGSGKTSLLNGLRLMKLLVLHGGTRSVTENLRYNPFLFDVTSKNKDTEFGVRISIQNQIYDYSFKYNSKVVDYEKLSLITKAGKEKIYFERKNKDFTVKNEKLESAEGKVRENALFLFTAQENNDEISSKVYKWFDKDLLIIRSRLEIPEYLIRLMENEELKNEMVSFLQCADFNIKDINLRQIAVKTDDFSAHLAKTLNISIPEKQYELFTIHTSFKNNKPVGQSELPLQLESVGTRRIFYIMLTVIYSQLHGNSKTLLIDEFDNSLHSELASTLIKIFNSEQSQNQYILTTHNVELLDDDIRVDQMLLMEKNAEGISHLKSIYNISASSSQGRHDVSFAKRYIKGQFGAVPSINLDQLKTTLDTIHKKFNK